ncbi:MerR family transcriptional regulator [Kineosporia sp. A_224]|uniref:MerR family transcriptional regulator n=1 Tax=Kineosporia sp. A_224 TaxID=1962180 RepID=UPI000B4B5491|nr:MerR family transcriptional regulator [Kineosporia sp. A_224]
MLTIGRLAAYAGVTTKTVRVYHAKGLLPEPARDAAGYRRYTGRDVATLLEIRTLTQAGVPLAAVRDLLHASPEDLSDALARIDQDLGERIRRLRTTRAALRRLAAGESTILPPDVTAHLDLLPQLGFTSRWTELVTDLWVLAFATQPGTARALFDDQRAMLEDPDHLAVFLEYDRVHDLDPDDPRIAALAARIVAATRARYGDGALPGQDPASEPSALSQATVNATSPAWKRLDTLIRADLAR